MQGSWNHTRPYYRCKFPAEYAIAKDQHPKTIYVREDSLTPAIDQWLAQLFDDDHIDDTCAALEAATGPDPTEHNRLAAARKKLKECDNKLAKYRRALEAGADPAIVGGWIDEVKLPSFSGRNSLTSTGSRAESRVERRCEWRSAHPSRRDWTCHPACFAKSTPTCSIGPSQADRRTLQQRRPRPIVAAGSYLGHHRDWRMHAGTGIRAL